MKHGIPSHVTFWQILTHSDKPQVIAHFNQWASTQNLLPYDWLSGDGKSLRSTLSHCQDSAQNFSTVVSLFCQKTGLVHLLADYRNKKHGQGEILRSLLPFLKDKGVIITLDALHIQKKQWP
ncbi:MAG: hypothetical protein LH606_10355 [Cytophagaceae bacterium]|nr:hypothetical protein [Cytophagaceae bacterium]